MAQGLLFRIFLTPPKEAAMHRKVSAGIFVLTLFLAAGAYAASDKADQPKLSKEDQTFMRDAAQSNQMEVQLGGTASQKATNDRVKAFGKRMNEDHSKANKELEALAQKKNVQLPKSLDSKHKSEVDRLSKLSGNDFDRQYMDAMVKHHKEDVQKFERASKNAKDSDVKELASKQLPTLKEHLDLAQTTQKELKKGVNTAKAK
jgi:putative membrane protein